MLQTALERLVALVPDHQDAEMRWWAQEAQRKKLTLLRGPQRRAAAHARIRTGRHERR
ncbi:hypothetical protein IPZ70_07130 [Streptomyces polychromogenes]|nr:hypothetical protein [Streptomyces polychromogenes]